MNKRVAGRLRELGVNTTTPGKTLDATALKVRAKQKELKRIYNSGLSSQEKYDMLWRGKLPTPRKVKVDTRRRDGTEGSIDRADA